MTLKFRYIIKTYTTQNVTIPVVLNQRDNYRNTTNVTADKIVLKIQPGLRPLNEASSLRLAAAVEV